MTGVLKPIFDPKIQYARPRPPAVWLAPSSGALTDGRDTAAGTATAFIWTDAAIVDFAAIGGGNGSTQLVLTLPSHSDGDLLVAQIAIRVSSGLISYPAGWTDEGSGTFTKVASSEPPTITFTFGYARCAVLYCWSVQGSDGTAYDVGLNTNSGPSYTFTGGGLILMTFSGYGDGSSAYNADNVTDFNHNIGTAQGVYNFAAGHYGQVGGGGPTGQLFAGRISVASGGDNKQQTIRIVRLAQL